MKWIGLTGGIASGKSTVSGLLRSRGVPVVDADELAREVVKPGTPGFDDVIRTFGKRVVGPDGELDRPALGRVVFADSAARARLEAIIHPRVRELAEKKRRELAAAGHALGFYDVPLLFEKKMESLFDDILVVACSPEVQLERLMKRNGLARADAVRRLDAQLPLSLKTVRAEKVILNDGSLADLERGVSEFLESAHQAQT